MMHDQNSPLASGASPNLKHTLQKLRTNLLAERTPSGHWVGWLSPSALSTATAVSAVAAVLRSTGTDTQQATSLQALVQRGIGYLRTAQNADGGFGDTDRSHSNIATTYLAVAAFRLASPYLSGPGFSPNGSAQEDVSGDDTSGDALRISRAESYLKVSGEIDGLRARYGTDKTFVVPILTNCAIAGMVPWKEVPRLPFEAALFPQSMYRFLQMPVVSYAIPALVAIGQARHFQGPPAFLPIRAIRAAAVPKTMRVLESMQPASGGYLEATPLTAFVLMSLAATDRADCQVARRAIEFLERSVLEDGSWPIDTNLATWVSSLSMFALAETETLQLEGTEDSWCSQELIDWHLSCQHRQRHPFTGASPGGWGWSDLSGAVPDGDDTPGAMLALSSCLGRAKPFGAAEDRKADIERACLEGAEWLLKLQNRDGGWPTFCRGWGKLPFDRSSVDLTAHAIRALTKVFSAESTATGNVDLKKRVDKAIDKGFEFLERQQQADGRWLPLWFGNQDLPNEENPFYGTGRVLLAYAEGKRERPAVVQKAVQFLVDQQNPDGGWGGGPSLGGWLKSRGYATENPQGISLSSSVEETAVVTEGLAAVAEKDPNLALSLQETKTDPTTGENPDMMGTRLPQVISRGAHFLVDAVAAGREQEAWPIGFYFAKLWYHERMYPAVFATSALCRVLKFHAANDNASETC